MRDALTVLGIETSCDDTAAAVVQLDATGRSTVLSSVVRGQTAAHAPFRGVVPEIAARAHVELLDGAIDEAMQAAGLDFGDLDGVAATAGPGLIGGVMVGLTTAKAIALAHDLPLLAINHLEGHALSPRLEDDAPFPYLLLLASGGHCQFLAVTGVGAYRRLGSTIDDAAGEAFDKVAKTLGLAFPGGPEIEKAAAAGDASRFAFPRPLKGRPGCDLSFAGLKTAVARVAQDATPLDAKTRADIAASFQAAVIDVLRDRAAHAIDMYLGLGLDGRRLVAAGGVAANAALRGALERVAADHDFAFCAPPLRFCTDNAAMIALAGAERMRVGFSANGDTAARPRWPLDEASAAMRPTHLAGRKGVKA